MELAALYTYCDLFIYPSFVEGFGIPPLEAIVAGATTLCSERTAMADYSFLGDKLFNPGNLDELSTKIDKYLSLPKEYKRIDGEREFVLQKYNWSNIADEFLDAIDRLP